jgi:hypothetical protein
VRGCCDGSNLEMVDLRTNFLHFLPSSFVALDRLQV